MLTTFNDWVQWKRRCAIELCDGDTRDRLERFVQGQFRALARRLARFRPDLVWRFRELTEDSPAARRDCAHLFDSYMIPTGKDGRRKPYKDAMMQMRATEGKDPQNPTQEEQAAAWAGYAIKCIRTVFHDFINYEIEGGGEVEPPKPIDVPAARTDGKMGSPLGSTLPGKGLSPGKQAKINAIYRVVDAIVLDDREHLVLWADAHNMNRTGHEMRHLAGVGRAQLSAAAKQLEKKIVAKVAEHCEIQAPKQNEQPKEFQDMLEACWDRLVLKHRNLVPEKQTDGSLLWVETPSLGLAPPSQPA